MCAGAGGLSHCSATRACNFVVCGTTCLRRGVTLRGVEPELGVTLRVTLRGVKPERGVQVLPLALLRGVEPELALLRGVVLDA